MEFCNKCGSEIKSKITLVLNSAKIAKEPQRRICVKYCPKCRTKYPQILSCKPSVMWYIVFDLPYSYEIRKQIESVDHCALYEVSMTNAPGTINAVLGMGVGGKTMQEAKRTAREILDLAGIKVS